MFLHFAAVAEIVFHDASLLQKPGSFERLILAILKYLERCSCDYILDACLNLL